MTVTKVWIEEGCIVCNSQEEMESVFEGESEPDPSRGLPDTLEEMRGER